MILGLFIGGLILVAALLYLIGVVWTGDTGALGDDPTTWTEESGWPE